MDTEMVDISTEDELFALMTVLQDSSLWVNVRRYAALFAVTQVERVADELQKDSQFSAARSVRAKADQLKG